MTTVLIVDDEYLTRRGLRETIAWGEYGFEIVGEASNGNDAYERYLELRPDIIITDVRMKRATGLDLIQKLKNLPDFDSEVIILSAYDDFEYVKKALEFHVGAYILKPIQEKELLSAMLRLQSVQQEKRRKDHLVENMVQQLPMMRNDFLKALFEGKQMQEDDLLQQCRLFEISLPTEEYTVVSIKLDHVVNTTENIKQLHQDLEETLSYCKELPNALKFLSCTMAECHVVLLVYHHDDNYKLLQSSLSLLNDFLLTIKEQFEAVTSRTISAGYSMGHRGISEIHEAYEESKRALAHKSFVGDNTIVDYISVPKVMNAALVIPNEDIERILDAVRNDRYADAKEILENFFDKVKKNSAVDLESLKDVILEMTVMLLRLHFKNVEEINEIYGRPIVPSNELRKLGNVEAVEHWVYEIVEKMFAAKGERDKRNYVIRIQEMIDRQYSISLTAESVAEQLHISSYYLMHLFKEEMGMTFNQYLTKIRIEKAQEMIQSGKYKIYEVAQAVGYRDSAYFSYIYKKVTGHSPKREKNKMTDLS